MHTCDRRAAMVDLSVANLYESPSLVRPTPPLLFTSCLFSVDVLTVGDDVSSLRRCWFDDDVLTAFSKMFWRRVRGYETVYLSRLVWGRQPSGTDRISRSLNH